MATRPVGTIYPRARGKHITMLNNVVDDLIEGVVQCWLCGEGPAGSESYVERTDQEWLAHLWKIVHEYSGKVIKYHKY